MCAKVLERNLTQQDDARMLDDLLQKAGRAMASASEILKAYLHCARTPAEDAVERIRTQLKKAVRCR